MSVRNGFHCLAFVAALLPALAAAQTFPTIPSQTVVGRTALGPGPAQAIPFAQLSANFCSNFTLTLKGCVPAPGATTGRYLSDDTATPWKAVPTQQVVAGAGVTLNGTCAGNAINCTVNATAATQYVLPSRAAAAASDLSALSSIQTLGYSTPGDGGGATFKNIGSAPFIDSFITSYTIQGGSGYTNGGPYYGNLFVTGTKPFAVGTVTVSAGAFTAVDITGTPGLQCAIGDVLPFVGSAAAVPAPNSGMPAGGTGGSITVTGCSTPLGSFTDAVGTRFQIVTPNGANAFQFGARGDWNGVDTGTTDNFNSLQALFWYVGFKSSYSYDGGGFWGGVAHIPQGAFMACGTGLKPLIVPMGVRVQGASTNGSSIKFCTAWDAATYQVTLGDNNWHFACFGNSLNHLQLRADSGSTYIVYSNCGQDYAGLYQTFIFSNGDSIRPCLHYEKGFGGASTFVIRDLTCAANSNSPQVWLGNTAASGMNLGSTMVEVTNLVAGANSGSTGNHQTEVALQINGGWVNVNRFHFESIAGGIRVNIPVSSNGEYVTIQNVNGGGLPVYAPCPGMIILDGNNTPGNATISQVQVATACATTVLNGQSGGVSYAPGIGRPAVFDPSYHSF
jgi:hypothetical protein